jgi:hypothetical protein
MLVRLLPIFIVIEGCLQIEFAQSALALHIHSESAADRMIGPAYELLQIAQPTMQTVQTDCFTAYHNLKLTSVTDIAQIPSKRNF